MSSEPLPDPIIDEQLKPKLGGTGLRARNYGSLRPNRGISLDKSAFAQPANVPSGVWSSSNSGNYKTLRAIRPVDANGGNAYSHHDDKSHSRDNSPSRSALPSHLARNVASLNGNIKDEVTIVRSKEEEEEDRKLREAEALLTWDQKQKMAEKALKVREEIMSTERSYVACLRVLCDAFVTPLQETPLEDLGIQESHRSALVSNLGLLVKFHDQFIGDLEKDGVDKCEHAFIKYSPFFRMYTTYLNDYQKCFDTLQALRQTKRFQQFLSDVRATLLKKDNLDLMSYMIMPVQRVPRYVLLLKELKRNTLPSQPAFDSINKALAQITLTAAHINESKRQIENMNTLFEIQHRISGDVRDLVLIQPYRRFIREGELMVHDPNKKSLFGTMKQVSRVFFLFSDILLWTNKDLSFKAFTNLAATKITVASEDPHTPYDTDMAARIFEISNFERHMVVTCADAATCQSWVHDIRVQLQEQQDARSQKRLVRGAGRNNKTMHSWIVDRITSDVSTKRDGDAEDSVSRTSADLSTSISGTSAPASTSASGFRARTLRGGTGNGLADKLKELKLQQQQ